MPAYKHRVPPTRAARPISRSTAGDAPDMIVSQAPNRAPHHWEAAPAGADAAAKKPCCKGCADGHGCEGMMPHPLLIVGVAAVAFYLFVLRRQ